MCFFKEKMWNLPRHFLPVKLVFNGDIITTLNYRDNKPCPALFKLLLEYSVCHQMLVFDRDSALSLPDQNYKVCCQMSQPDITPTNRPTHISPKHDHFHYSLSALIKKIMSSLIIGWVCFDKLMIWVEVLWKGPGLILKLVSRSSNTSEVYP